jgi:predicted DNA-binding transcriptional regulator AlpA
MASGAAFCLCRPALHNKGRTAPMATNRKTRRFLSKLQVLEKTGRSYPSIWAWMQAGTFPRAREIDNELVWWEDEVDQWMEERPIRLFKNDKKKSAAAEA